MQSNPETTPQSTIQIAEAEHDLIQVGRDYIQYIRYNIKQGKWGVVIANLSFLGFIFFLLASGLYAATKSVRQSLNMEANAHEVCTTLTDNVDEMKQQIAASRGIPGKPGRGISSVKENQDGTFSFLFSDNTEFKTSKLIGPPGQTGAGIKQILNNDDGSLSIQLDNGKTHKTKSILGQAGKNGKTGEVGRGITAAKVNTDGTLTFTYSDGKTSTTSNSLRGPQGSKGEKGDIGESGEIGPQGEKGPQGDRGPTGRTGETGSTGPQGERGLQGPPGETGPCGARGPQGPEVPRGPRGFPGGLGDIQRRPVTPPSQGDTDSDTLF